MISIETIDNSERGGGEISWPAITVIIIAAFMVFLDSSIVNVDPHVLTCRPGGQPVQDIAD